MAAMIITRKAVFSSSFGLLHKLLSPVRPLAATSPMSRRSLYTNFYPVPIPTCRRDGEEEDDSMTLSENEYTDNWNVKTLFHGLLDHPDPMRSTVLKVMETPNPVLLAKSQGRRDGWRRGFHIREDEDGVYLRIEMPGLGKEDVKVSVDRNSLIIRSQGEKESEDDDESGRSFTSRIGFGFGFLPQKYKLDQIKGEMKNGLLRLSVPKVKEEEEKTKDVFEVKIE